MTLLTSGQTVSGSFDETSHGIIVDTYTFHAVKEDRITLRANCFGYNPAQLSIAVLGPAPSTALIAEALTVLTLTITATGTYTVNLIY